MKRFTSWAVGVVAFAGIASFAQPAVARDGFYVDPAPAGVGSYTIEEYCRDDLSYRTRHPDRCVRYLDRSGYFDSGHYDDRDDDSYRDRHHRHHHHHDRDDDRDQRDRDY